jgi:hypothetical protein
VLASPATAGGSLTQNHILEELYGTRRARQEAALSFAEIEKVLEEKGDAARED